MAFILIVSFLNFFSYASLTQVSLPYNLDFGYIGNFLGGFQYQGNVPQINYQAQGYVPQINNQHNNNSQNSSKDHSCSQNVRIQSVTKVLFSHGKEPFWSVETKSIYFVDSGNSTICRYAVHTKELFCATIGTERARISDLLPILNKPHKFFSTYDANLTVVTWDGTNNKTSFRKISQPDPSPTNIVNDARTDSRGVPFFWTEPNPSTGFNSIARNQSRMYNLINGKVTTLLTNYSFGNGIGFSGSFIFFSDALTNRTYKSYYDRATNSIKYTRLLIDYNAKNVACAPDSLTMDTDGYVWTTCNGQSQILKLDPNTGYVVCSIKLPAKAPVDLTFGECPGVKNGVLNCLYVTTSRSAAPRPPTQYDGALLLVQNTGSRGSQPTEVVL